MPIEIANLHCCSNRSSSSFISMPRIHTSRARHFRFFTNDHDSKGKRSETGSNEWSLWCYCWYSQNEQAAKMLMAHLSGQQLTTTSNDDGVETPFYCLPIVQRPYTTIVIKMLNSWRCFQNFTSRPPVL